MTGTGGSDTIAALATPPGRGAVAIVRLSGPLALSIATRLTGKRPAPRRAELCVFRDTAGQRIDEGLLLFFPSPRSYTGEDVVELQGHGGHIVSDWLLASAFELGARPARPGEFTLRAFLNDKLDLAQAEAVADLVDSGSRLAVQAAARSLSGQFSQQTNALQAALTELRAHIEAWLDFPEEELDLAAAAELDEKLTRLRRGLRALTEQAQHGSVLRDGLSIVIAGPPNAGKSSLMNRLAGYDAAIVTPIPGTTRDALRESLSIDGLPVSVIDTAGLRAAADPVELEGVRRAQSELRRADRALWVVDVTTDAEQALTDARTELGDEKPLTVIHNKIDLLGAKPACVEQGPDTLIRLSALTGEGVDLLRTHLKIAAGYRGEVTGTFSARRRHLDALARAGDCLDAAAGELRRRALELAAEELRGAQQAVSELTGEQTSDDLLGEIFASFCIGK